MIVCGTRVSCPEKFPAFENKNYVSRTFLGEFTGEIFVEEALKMIEENLGGGGLRVRFFIEGCKRNLYANSKFCVYYAVVD